jgi:hypothetical protein
MIKRLCCETPFRRISLGWLSFQPDGSISCGLSYNTFISPKLKGRHFSWNLFKEIQLQDQVPSDPSALEPVHNPLFTYQPQRHWFQLMANTVREEHELFAAIVDMELTLRQQSRMPWIRAVSAPLVTLPTHAFRSPEGPVEEFIMFVPGEHLSACIELTFEKSSASELRWDQTTWCIAWHNVALRIRLSFMGPRIATLSWFQFHSRERDL